MEKEKVMIIIGSKSDSPIAEKVAAKLREFDVKFECFVASAHRTPKFALELAKSAKEQNFKVIIAIAGMAAHLAGVVASSTTLPVIGLPVECSVLGIDSLLSIVQMPPGVPVATVGINSAENAAILAVQILSTSNQKLISKLEEMKVKMSEKVMNDNENLKI